MDDASREAASSEPPTVYCDSCAVRIPGARYKCQACHDFDYCPECFKEATLTHPGHEFRKIGTGRPLKGPAQDRSDPLPAASSAQSASPDDTGRCRSCAPLTLGLPPIDIAIRETQNRTRQKLDDWIRQEVPDEGKVVEDPKLNKRLAEELYKDLGRHAAITLADLESLPLTRLYAHHAEEARREEQEENSPQLTASLADVIQCSLGGCAPITLVEYAPEKSEDSTEDSQASSKKRRVRRQTSTQPVFFLWRVRISGLVEATQRGCAFCSFFLSRVFAPTFGDWMMDFYSLGVRNTWYTRPKDHPAERTKVVSACMDKLTKLKYDRFDFYVAPICSKKDSKLPDFNKLRFDLHKAADDPELLRGWFPRVLLPSLAGLISFEVDAYTTRNDPVARTLTSRTPNPSPLSEESFRVVKGWVSNCDQNHATCLQGPGLLSDLPRRLVEIEDNGFLKLHEASPGEQGQYVALSYCWGGSETFQTTKATIAKRRNGFVIADLPRTIRDAVRVTQIIGLKYIWVDSLCIVQDDLPDKAQDIGRMAQVYKGSYLTISASRADDADKGFLSENADESTGLWKGLIPLDYRVPSPSACTLQQAFSLPGEKGTLWLYDESDGVREVFKTPTSRRGWCLQEHILSPRLLSYGRWPTWRCREATDTDGGFYTSETSMRDNTGTLEHRLLDILFDSRRTNNPSKGLDMFTAIQLYHSWYAVVHDFSKREISLSSDRLPAIGAVASEISELTGGRYMAGLWEQNMLHDLMWFTKAMEWASRPPEWRAPSWSWASVDSTIIYGSVTADSRPLATVGDCKCTLRYPAAPFGEVVCGSVELQGRLALVDTEDVNRLFVERTVGPRANASLQPAEWLQKMLRHTEDINGMRCFNPDKKEFESRPVLDGSVYGLVTFSRDWVIEDQEKVNQTCFSGLFLKEAENKIGCYERVGAFFNETKAWLDPRSESWKTASVVII